MKRDNEFINDGLIDLGEVTVETKGPAVSPEPDSDNIGDLPGAGLAD